MDYLKLIIMFPLLLGPSKVRSYDVSAVAETAGFCSVEYISHTELTQKVEHMSSHKGFSFAINCIKTLLKTVNDAESKLILLHKLSLYSEQVGSIEQSVDSAIQGLSLAAEEDKKQYLPVFHIDLVWAYAANKEYSKAYAHFLKVTLTESENTSIKYDYFSAGSRIFGALGFRETALDYSLKALQWDKEQSLTERISARYNIAIIYTRLGRCIEARDFVLQGKSLVDERDLVNQAGFNILEAEIALCDGELKSALNILSQNQSYPDYLPSVYKIMHATFLLETKTKLNIDKENEILALIELLNSPVDRMHKQRAKKALADAFLSIGDYGNAYRYLDEVYNLTLKIHESVVDNMAIRWDTEYKLNDAKLSALNAQQELLKNAEEAARLRSLVTLGMMIIILLAVGLYGARWKINYYRKSSLTDTLTDAPNRRSIYDQAEHFITLQSNELKMVSIMDLDNFKQINDMLGHDVGDEVLKCFASACKQTIRGTDSFGRSGGEEWLMINNVQRPEDAEILFLRLKEKFQKLLIKNSLPKTDVTFSMGCIIFCGYHTNIDELVKAADTALYQAKHNGKDQVKIIFSH